MDNDDDGADWGFCGRRNAEGFGWWESSDVCCVVEVGMGGVEGVDMSELKLESASESDPEAESAREDVRFMGFPLPFARGFVLFRPLIRDCSSLAAVVNLSSWYFNRPSSGRTPFSRYKRSFTSLCTTSSSSYPGRCSDHR